MVDGNNQNSKAGKVALLTTVFLDKNGNPAEKYKGIVLYPILKFEEGLTTSIKNSSEDTK